MKNKLSVSILILFLGLTLFSCKPDDKELSLQVQQALSVDQLKINSTVKDGVVTLTGMVNSEEEKSYAEGLIKNIKDFKSIKSVVNNIEVKKPEPVVEVNPDDTLKTTINDGLTAAGFKDITVEVNQGEVTLNGTVKKADLQKVMQIANESKPKKVNNNLTIKK